MAPAPNANESKIVNISTKILFAKMLLTA